MIKLQVIGHLGKDCQVNNVNGKSVINFSIAHSERYKDNMGNQKEKTTWVECAYWTDRTAISPYLKKGQLVYAEGSPEVRTYQTNDGRNGAALSLRISNVQLLGSKQGGENGGGYNDNGNSNYNNGNSSQSYNQSKPQPQAVSQDNMDASDDLPF